MRIFTYHNTKVNLLGDILGVKVGCFETSVGLSCPYAWVCKCTVEEKADGSRYIIKHNESGIRCFAAVQEVLFPDVFAKRRINTLLAKSGEFFEIAYREFRREKFQVFRPHSAGDYDLFVEYMSWRALAKKFPDVMFFGYTKNIQVFNHLIDYPLDNYKLVYSWGGMNDSNVRTGSPICYINGKGLFCPDDIPVISLKSGEDYYYITSGKSFAIPYH